MQCKRHPNATFDPYLNCEACEVEWQAGIEEGEREAERQEEQLWRDGYFSRRCAVCGRYKREQDFCSAGCRKELSA